MDHINGNKQDNRLENLRLLCPNCHSQMETFGSGNIKKKRKITDEDILIELSKTKSVKDTVKNLDLTVAGHNYYRIQKLINE